MKSNLRKVLPGKLREDFLWQSGNTQQSFEEFKQFILSQAAAILQDRKQAGGVHAVQGNKSRQRDTYTEQPEQPLIQPENDEIETVDTYDVEGNFIGTVQLRRKGAGKSNGEWRWTSWQRPRAWRWKRRRRPRRQRRRR